MKDLIYTVYMIKLNEVVMYVGKTSDFERRKYEHLNRIGTTYSAVPDGLDLSEVTIIKAKDFSDSEEALKYEDELILQYNTINNGWNKLRSGHVSSTDKYDSQKTLKYRSKHKEEYKAYMKKWREAHREEIKAYKREQYRKRKLNNKEEQN